ncbi:MAG TPA: hypothetical protein VLM85_19820, partial [Polyangiaceae bacterium]|nr:hypothetical protein [Polyangiaceae bacterium]
MPAKLLAERARAVRAIRGFFEGRGFVEVETPAIVPSPGMDLHLDAFAIAPPAAGQVTGEGAAWLITSPEYQM